MPWKVSGAVEQRLRFVTDLELGLHTMSELCSRYGITRQCGYKWLDRYRKGGVEGLWDRSRAPRRSPQRIEAELADLLLDLRRRRPTWGPRKLLAKLAGQYPGLRDSLPAASSVGELFRRQGLVQPRKRRQRPERVDRVPLKALAPNDVWSADFKGEFRLADGRYCYPFTVSDAFSRFLISCRAESSTSLEGVRQGLTRAFREYGVPRAIRTDNGIPFCGQGRTGLSQLGVWWLKLGVIHQRIEPGRPDQNGRHERMHRTLKAEATRPPEASLEAQQARFDAFVWEFNYDRPHEALGQQTPATLYERSVREFTEELKSPEYPGHYEVRKVDAAGHFKFSGISWFLAHPLKDELVALVEIDDDIWSIFFYSQEIGRLNPRSGNIVIKVSTMSPV